MGDNVNTTQFDNAINETTRNFIDLTHQLNNYNEINNTNLHLEKIHNKEKENLNYIGNVVKSTSLKTKQEYLLTEYSIELYRLRNNLMIFTLIVLCGILALCAMFAQGRLSQDKTIGFIILILIAWALIIYIIIKVNSNRRKYAWNQQYWRQMKTPTSAY